MPETPSSKHIPHPGKRARPAIAPAPRGTPAYAELQVTTNFTFLSGASHPEQLVDQAAALGYRGLAVTDRHTLAGAVRMHVAAKQAGIALAVGARLTLAIDDPHTALDLLAYPTDRAAYGRLCQLLTLGKRRTVKGQCDLWLHDWLEHQQGLLAVLVPPRQAAGVTQAWLEAAAGLRHVMGSQRLSLAVSCHLGPDDSRHLERLADLGRHLDLPLAATNDVLYHQRQCKPLQDVLVCIRAGVDLDQAGYRLTPNAEHHLKPPAEMHRLLARYPHAIARSVEILEQAAAFSLDQLRYEYPHETCPADREPIEHLRDLTWQGAARRYGGRQRIPAPVARSIEHEMTLIADLGYPHYFLTVHDIVSWSRARGILCQGRGAAANSAVCFCLGITEVDPARFQLLFERFVSRERHEPPDIDVDFEHERREEAIQYIYGKYGRHRAALTAEVITYRTRSAIREVGKALGLSLDTVDRLAKQHDWYDPDGVRPAGLREMGLNPNDRALQHLAALVKQILGFPRHLSQHVGGFVLTERPLSETVPIENAAMPDRTIIEWDKDDIDALGMLKVDILGLGMLTAVRKSFDIVAQTTGQRCTMATVPAEDPAVYDMICRADTVGVFQIESRAQMSMLPRLRPRTFYDLVIEVAIVRPGPIQGGMVHPYLRRRTGAEPVEYPSEAVREVLERTLGVPLFQEQAMALAVRAAGLTPGEADQLRRAMAAWKRKGDKIAEFGKRIIGGMIRNGYPLDFAQRCFEQIQGFSEYGFPESHAASFALIVYVSAWLKHHHPTAFAAALINSQPMGFYAPAQVVRDVREHGHEVRPIDINHSQWDCTVEPAHHIAPSVRAGSVSDRCSADTRPSLTLRALTDRSIPALRLGMRLVRSLPESDARRIAAAVQRHGFIPDIDTLRRCSGASITALRHLAEADAFTSMGLDRQQALWHIGRLRDDPLPLFEPVIVAAPGEDDATLPAVAAPARTVHDYRATGLSLKAHPIAFLRTELDRRRVTPNAHLADPQRCPHGRRIAVAGVVLVRQRPSTASGIVFITLEDETGVANLIVRPRIYQRYRRVAGHCSAVLVHGAIERDSTTGQVVHVMARSFQPLHDPADLPIHQRNFH